VLYPGLHFHHGECPPRYKRCFRQHGFSCVILRLHVTRSLLSALYIAHARHDRDVDVWLEHDALAARRSLLDSRTTRARRLLRLILPVVDSHAYILRRFVPALFHVCRVCFSKHDLPRRHGALASYIRCQRWDNIDGSYVEVYMRQASITLDNISGFQFVPCFTRGLYSVSGAQAVRAHGSHTNFEIAPSL